MQGGRQSGLTPVALVCDGIASLVPSEHVVPVVEDEGIHQTNVEAKVLRVLDRDP